MRVIALEEHFVAPVMAAGVASRPAPEAVRSKLSDLGEGRLADMDAAGIDYQVIGHSAPGAQALSGEEAISASREVNDALAEAMRRHPDRLGGFASLPTSEPDAAAEELRRAREELGFLGAMINGQTGGRFLDDPMFRPVLAEAERLGVPIYLHPAEPPEAVRAAYFRGFEPAIEFFLATSAWGWHSEAGLHVLRLVLGGVFDRFPQLQLIVGHMGEMLPFMLSRIDDILARAPTRLERPVSDYIRGNVHITTSGIFSLPPLLCALMVLGVERVMFSVDYPYSANDAGTGFLAAAAISPADKELIAHSNAERLLGL
jgi:predicted TIM-barrel fold metal-dependent hydrolase